MLMAPPVVMDIGLGNALSIRHQAIISSIIDISDNYKL